MTTETGLIRRISLFLEMIKFSHTIFALPFALTGALMAAGGVPSLRKVFWIIVAMTGARTAAMGLNRLIDASIDAQNPRTSGRAIPSGLVSRGTAVGFIIAAVLLLLVAAWRLNPLCLSLAPVAIFFLVLYSYCKRFTSLAHVVLGVCLGAAPVGAWIAVRGDIALPPILLGGAVLCWVAGFDVLYALQDIDFDRKAGLHSIPVSFGVKGSLMIARGLHLAMLLLLLLLHFFMGLGIFFMLGIVASAILLFYEHWLLRGGDLGKLDVAFFTANGYVSVIIFIASAIFLWL